MRADPGAVELYLHEHIPITRAMEVSVLAADEAGVRLAAPLAANINHRSTVFGGSASTLAILSAWTLVHLRLRDESLRAQIVIQRNSMDYLRPMRDDFQAFCPSPQPEVWQRFVATLRRRSRARLALSAELTSGGERAGRFEGDYVAVLAGAPPG